MFLWKIEPFDIPSTDRTRPVKQIIALEVGYWGGKVAVLDAAICPITLVIDYYDNEGIKRDYLQDRVEVGVIREKAIALGLEGEALEGFVKGCMDKIVKNLIGGETIEVRWVAFAELASMFGQVALPIEAQDGMINN